MDQPQFPVLMIHSLQHETIQIARPAQICSVCATASFSDLGCGTWNMAAEKADKKEPFYVGGGRGGNLEHQPSGLIWSLDNWLYTTYNSYRLRYTDGKVEKEKTANNSGQWGLTQDNYGKPWFVNAGGERGPLNYQTPIVYGNINVRGQEIGDWKSVWPIDNIPDVQGGPRRVRKDNTLNHFTATCGQEVFRGDRLPKELIGDLFFGEPVGRLALPVL